MSTLTPAATDTYLMRLREEFCESVCDLTAEQTQWRPKNRQNAWCIQQIVEHLLLTYAATSGILNERLLKGSPTKKPATFAQRCIQFTVTTIGYFPAGQQAPMFVMPQTDAAPLSGQELASAIAENIAALEALIKDCEQVLGRGRSVTHGVMGPMSMRQWRKFQLVHARHHIRQIRVIRSEHGV